ncbi:MAG TPA: hypothetical protein VGB45_16730 [Abditibacterium sp.]|jgi:hypothetical protein
MKIGFIFECPRGGPDQLVIEFLARKIDSSVEIVNSATNTNKPALVRDCGTQAALLLKQGCERVVIVWDLLPRWADTSVKPYCKRDVALIRASLAKVKVDEERVRLLCIAAELEVFLIADERALAKVLSRPTRAADCPFKKHPHRLADPKADLDSIFRAHGRVYSPLSDALPIARALDDFNRLNPIPCFKRLITEVNFTCSRHLSPP